MSTLLSALRMLSLLPDAIPVVLAATAGAFAAVGLNRLIQGSAKPDGSKD